MNKRIKRFHVGYLTAIALCMVAMLAGTALAQGRMGRMGQGQPQNLLNALEERFAERRCGGAFVRPGNKNQHVDHQLPCGEPAGGTKRRCPGGTSQVRRRHSRGSDGGRIGSDPHSGRKSNQPGQQQIDVRCRICHGRGPGSNPRSSQHAGKSYGEWGRCADG